MDKVIKVDGEILELTNLQKVYWPEEKRLKSKGDLFKGVLGKGVNVEKSLKNLGA